MSTQLIWFTAGLVIGASCVLVLWALSLDRQTR